MEWEIGAPGKAYTSWAAKMAVGLGTGVPWVMCKQEDAPDPVVSHILLPENAFDFVGAVIFSINILVGGFHSLLII